MKWGKEEEEEEEKVEKLELGGGLVCSSTGT